jgi:hypothetical protein
MAVVDRYLGAANAGSIPAFPTNGPEYSVILPEIRKTPEYVTCPFLIIAGAGCVALSFNG